MWFLAKDSATSKQRMQFAEEWIATQENGLESQAQTQAQKQVKQSEVTLQEFCSIVSGEQSGKY